MWQKLSDPQHVTHCASMGTRLAPLRRLLSQLASRPYSDKVYGHWSHDRFFIGTAPSYEEADDPVHIRIMCIESDGNKFQVGYGDNPESPWGWSEESGKVVKVGCWRQCKEDETVLLVDTIVPRDLEFQAAKESHK